MAPGFPSPPLPLPISAPLFLLLVVVIPITTHPSSYFASFEATWSCSDLQNIPYPICLLNDSDARPISPCPYEGFNLTCRNSSIILRFGSSNYTVTRIDLNSYTITVADADFDVVPSSNDCLRLRHNFTLDPELPLRWTPSDDNLTFFYNCTDGGGNLEEYSIPCLSSAGGGPSYVLTREALEYPDRIPRSCGRVVVVPVLKDSLLSHTHELPLMYGGLLRSGFQLSLPLVTSGDCVTCEKSGGRCGLNKTTDSTWVFACFCSDGIKATPHCGAGGDKKKKRTPLLIGASAAAGVFLLCIVGFFIYRQKKWKLSPSFKSLVQNPSFKPSFQDPEMSSAHLQTHLFSYAELYEATNCFNASNELGDGGFGTVYKGKLQDGRTVAVKRLYENNCRRLEQFMNEIEILSRLRHKNLVTLYGCTSPRSQGLLLVYEFVSNGTVADHLHGSRATEGILTWPMRLSIAIETADALAYLHSVEPPIVHRDVKTCNILLDSSFHVKVGDFGLSRLFPTDVTHVSTAPQGTPGYLDPEYHQCYQLTDKSDVYSFGVVLIELFSSKPAIDMTRHRGEINLANMAMTRIQNGELEQLVDDGLGYRSDQATRKMITMVAEVAFRCLQSDGDMRPPIKEVLEALKEVQGEGLKVEDRAGENGGEIQDEAKLLKKGAPLSPDTVMNSWASRSTTPHTRNFGKDVRTEEESGHSKDDPSEPQKPKSS